MSCAASTEIWRGVGPKSNPTALAPSPIEKSASSSVVTPETLMNMPSVFNRTRRLLGPHVNGPHPWTSDNLLDRDVGGGRELVAPEQAAVREAETDHATRPRRVDVVTPEVFGRTLRPQHLVETLVARPLTRTSRHGTLEPRASSRPTSSWPVKQPLVNETVEATNDPPKHCGVSARANSAGPGRPASIRSSTVS